MFSTPPAMSTVPSPALMACAALAAACSPEPHSRLTVCPGTATGSPASNSAMRATLRLSSPAWLVQPRITSSMVAGSIPERSTTALIGTAARSSARMPASEPPCLPTGVRRAQQMSASRGIYRPTVRPFSQSDPHRLGLQIRVERLAPQIAAEPAGLEPAERRARVVEVVAVDPNRAGANRPGGAVRFLDILRPDPGREAVHRLIRDLYPVVEVIERQHGQHRPEDLLAGDRHRGLDAVEHGGLDVIAFPVRLHGFAAGDELRALLHALLDVGEHRLLLSLRDQRAEPRVLVQGIPRGEPLRPVGELRHDLV